MNFTARESKIIKLLSENTFLTSNDIALRMGISEKTVRNSIGIIKESAEQLGLNIKSTRGKGYSLIIMDQSRLDNFFKDMNESSPLGKKARVHALLKLILKESIIDTHELGSLWFVSDKTLITDFKEIDKIAKSFNLTIHKGREKIMHFVGDEINIRSLCYKYNLCEDNIYDDFLDSTINEILNKYYYLTSDLSLKLLKRHIILAINRLKNGHFIRNEYNQEIMNSKEFTIATEILDRIGNHYSLIFPLYEVGYLASHIIGKELKQEGYHTTISMETETLINEIVGLIRNSFNLEIKNEFDFKVSLGLHLDQLIKRLNYNTQIENPLLPDIKAQFPYAFTVALALSNLIYKKYHKTVNADETGYIALSIQLLLENDSRSICRKRILLVCSLGQSSANLMKYRYLDTFREQIESIDVSSAKALEFMDLNQYDYIFTMVPLKLKTNIPILNANFFLDDVTIENIKSNLSQHLNITPFMNERLVFVDNLDGHNKWDVLNQLCNKANEVENIGSELFESVRERELLASTDYAYRTALPHANKLMVNDTTIILAILEKPIYWEVQEVSMVALVLVGRSDSNHLQQFYSLFARFLMNEHYVNNVIESRNKQEFLLAINKVDENMRKGN